MSQAVVKTVNRANKDQGKCINGGEPLPVGSAYRYWKPGFRSRTKLRVCMRAECTPRRSQLEGSKLAAAYESIEAAEDTINDATSIEDVRDAVEECVSQLNDLASEYEDAIQANAALEDTLRDKIDQLESLASDLDGLDLEDPEEEPDAPEKPDRNDFGDEEDDEYNEALSEYEDELHGYETALVRWREACDDQLSEAKSSANDALSGAEF